VEATRPAVPAGVEVPGLQLEGNRERMDDQRDDMLTELERAMGYSFINRSLLEEALTHRSFLNESGGQEIRDNERLEFFGDAAIDFFLSRTLLDRFPDSREGDLTRIRAALVGEESLGNLARKIGLGRYLRLGRGEERSGGREKRSLLADAYEAVIAAVYLDGGAAPVQKLMAAHFGLLLETGAFSTLGRDYKTEFQELVQSLYGAVPRYIHGKAEGPDHARNFTVQAFAGDDFLGEGSGRTKKEAEQEAARTALERLAPGTSAAKI
jgi:ribonuclease-3